MGDWRLQISRIDHKETHEDNYTKNGTELAMRRFDKGPGQLNITVATRPSSMDERDRMATL